MAIKMHTSFCLGFYEDIRKNLELNNYSHRKGYKNWGIDVNALLKKGGSINTIVFFKYCIAIGKCPVKFTIKLLKPYINHEELIDYIRFEFDTTY
jgi:hypothetical protein